MKEFSSYASDYFKQGMSAYLSKLKREKSRNDYVTVLNDLMNLCKKDFLEIDSDDSFSFLHKLENDADNKLISWSTLNNKMARLHTISNYFVGLEFYSDYIENPFENPHRLNQDRMLHDGQILSVTEIDKFLEYAKANDNVYLASCIVLRMGLTTTELIGLKLSNFFMGPDNICYMNLPHRTVAVPGDIKNLLDHMIKKNALSEYIFIKDKSLRLTSRELQALCKELVPMNFNLQDLRNTCIVYAMKGGATAADISEYLGITDAWLYRYDNVVANVHFPTMADYSNIRLVFQREAGQYFIYCAAGFDVFFREAFIP